MERVLGGVTRYLRGGTWWLCVLAISRSTCETDVDAAAREREDELGCDLGREQAAQREDVLQPLHDEQRAEGDG